MSQAMPPHDVLVITADEAIARPAQRVVAAAGRNALVCGSGAALARWHTADAVLVGVDALTDLLKHDPMRRDSVYVIGADSIPDSAWRDCVALGANDALTLAESEGWLVDRLAVGSLDTRAGLTIRVIGSTGGCGASVTAAGLALAADTGVVVLDTDLQSGWIDLLLGLDADGLGWSELSNLRGRVGGDALRASIPTREGISLIASNRDRPIDQLPADAMRAAALAASGLGSLVVIDDHVTSALGATAAQLSDVTVLVATSDLRGGLAARAVLEQLRGAADNGRSLHDQGHQPVIVAARTVRRAALPTATFEELIELADSTVWLRESRRISRRVCQGQSGLVPRQRLIRDCAVLLERCRTLAGHR